MKDIVVVIIGTDVSGNLSGGGQSRHAAIVPGAEESISMHAAMLMPDPQ